MILNDFFPDDKYEFSKEVRYMKKYWRAGCVAILFLFSSIALVVAITNNKSVQIIPSVIAIAFTSIFTVNEFIKAGKK